MIITFDRGLNYEIRIYCGAALEPDISQCNQCGMDRQTKKSNVVNADGNLIEYGSDESGEVLHTWRSIIRKYGNK